MLVLLCAFLVVSLPGCSEHCHSSHFVPSLLVEPTAHCASFSSFFHRRHARCRLAFPHLRFSLVSGCGRRSAIALKAAWVVAQGQGMIQWHAQVCSKQLCPSPPRNHSQLCELFRTAAQAYQSHKCMCSCHLTSSSSYRSAQLGRHGCYSRYGVVARVAALLWLQNLIEAEQFGVFSRQKW